MTFIFVPITYSNVINKTNLSNNQPGFPSYNTFESRPTPRYNLRRSCIERQTSTSGGATIPLLRVYAKNGFKQFLFQDAPSTIHHRVLKKMNKKSVVFYNENTTLKAFLTSFLFFLQAIYSSYKNSCPEFGKPDNLMPDLYIPKLQPKRKE